MQSDVGVKGEDLWIEVVGGALIADPEYLPTLQESAFLHGYVTLKPGAVLLARLASGRRNAGLWELPGGKVEPGESHFQTIERELWEELGIRVRALDSIGTGTSGRVRLHGVRCVWVSGTVGAKLTDHDCLAWVEPSRLAEFPCPDADKPLFDALAKGR